MKRLMCSMAAASLFVLPVLADEKPKAEKAAASASAKPDATASDTNMEILRQKLKADKKALVADNMELTDAESKSFWPIYDAYQKDLAKANQRIGKLVGSYADAYDKGPVSNEVAKKLVSEYLAIEGSELDFKRSYASKLEKVLPAYKVARYLQLENKIRAAVKYELALEIPIVE